MANVYMISDRVYDNLVGLVIDTLDLLEPSDFEKLGLGPKRSTSTTRL